MNEVKICKNATLKDAAHRVITFLECAYDVVNVTKLHQEITVAKSNGGLETLFSKYCAKKNALTQCVNDFAMDAESCFEPNKLKTIEIMKNVTNNIITYVCYKEGNYTASKSIFLNAKHNS